MLALGDRNGLRYGSSCHLHANTSRHVAQPEERQFPKLGGRMFESSRDGHFGESAGGPAVELEIPRHREV